MPRSLILLLLLSACSTPFAPSDDAAIRAAMTEQASAWDRGDMEGYMRSYSDTVCFLSPRGRTCGRAEVTANYVKGYPDKEAMGDLEFGIEELLPVDADHVWLTGSWTLRRSADTLGGGFSLLWAREKDAWRIVRDHSY